MSAAKPKIGALRERVTLEAEHTQEALGGGYTRSSEMLGLAWAAITTKNSEVIVKGGQRRRRQTFDIIIRKRDRLEDIRRVLWLGRTLTVVGVMALPTRGYVALTCEEETAA